MLAGLDAQWLFDAGRLECNVRREAVSVLCLLFIDAFELICIRSVQLTSRMALVKNFQPVTVVKMLRVVMLVVRILFSVETLLFSTCRTRIDAFAQNFF